MQHPAATEYVRGLENLYATCDTSLEKPPFKNSSVAWKRTKHPATSPQIGTPAFESMMKGEDVWEPVVVLSG